MSANGLTLSNLQAIALFELLEDGTSIRRASRELGLPYVPLLLWLETNPAFMQALNADYALMVEALQSARRLVEADHPTMTKFVLERMDPSKWMPQTDTPQADATAIGNNLKSVINIVNQAPQAERIPAESAARPFRCEVCTKRTKSVWGLVQHQRKVHGLDPQIELSKAE